MIRASCPGCGPVDLRIHDLAVHRTGYRFECPSCELRVDGTAPRNELELLIAVGVPVTEDDRPEFTRTDLDALRALLDSEGWFEDLASMVDLD
jgi:hypothetical protein